ncbi:helix-turn-helix domain-containing protein [Bradyrhizobium liaoningense]
MNVVEYPIGGNATISAQGQPGVLRCFRSFPPSDIIEAIWDCDIPDGDLAKSLTIKCPPGTSLQLIGQYRKPARIAQSEMVLPSKCATHVQSHALTLFPTGAFGAVIVCLRSDAASRIVKAPFKEFANASLYLGDLFSNWEVAMCDDLLAGARTSQERIAGVQAFLLRQLSPQTDSLANRAAGHLRKNPAMPVSALAAQLGTSERNLSRGFKRVFGLSPKRFARLARFQKILAERRLDRSWAQVAHACGLSDQAHLIGEFHDLVGEAPTQFFTRELHIGAAGMDEANLIIQRTARAVDRS